MTLEVKELAEPCNIGEILKREQEHPWTVFDSFIMHGYKPQAQIWECQNKVQKKISQSQSDQIKVAFGKKN